MFIHDNVKGTDGYSTTQNKWSAVSTLVWNKTSAKCPISDTKFTSRKCLRARSLDRYKPRSDKLDNNE